MCWTYVGRQADCACNVAQGTQPLCFMLQALAIEFGERTEASHDRTSPVEHMESTFYEITIATVDQPKLLSRLSDAMVCSSWHDICKTCDQHSLTMQFTHGIVLQPLCIQLAHACT